MVKKHSPAVTPNRIAAGAFAGTSLATWLALELQRRAGVPAEVSAPVIGAAVAWFSRWAAKLVPSP